MDAAPECTLGELVVSRAGSEPVTVGTTVDLEGIRLRVREVTPEGVEVVGLEVLP